MHINPHSSILIHIIPVFLVQSPVFLIAFYVLELKTQRLINLKNELKANVSENSPTM